MGQMEAFNQLIELPLRLLAIRGVGTARRGVLAAFSGDTARRVAEQLASVRESGSAPERRRDAAARRPYLGEGVMYSDESVVRGDQRPRELWPNGAKETSGLGGAGPIREGRGPIRVADGERGHR